MPHQTVNAGDRVAVLHYDRGTCLVRATVIQSTPDTAEVLIDGETSTCHKSTHSDFLTTREESLRFCANVGSRSIFEGDTTTLNQHGIPMGPSNATFTLLDGVTTERVLVKPQSAQMLGGTGYWSLFVVDYPESRRLLSERTLAAYPHAKPGALAARPASWVRASQVKLDADAGETYQSWLLRDVPETDAAVSAR